MIVHAQAAALGFLAGVNKLLEFRASPDVRDDTGRTPIVLALKMRDAVEAARSTGTGTGAHQSVQLREFDDVVTSIDRALRCVRACA